MSKHDEDTRNAQAQLDQAAAQLDDLTVARLRATRRRALAAAQAQPARKTFWVPASIAAAVAVIALGIANFQPGFSTGSTVAANGDDTDWVLTKDSPDFSNDLDFYRWLENEQDAG
jgi:hypothetical protein